jgi:hypothetical protein
MSIKIDNIIDDIKIYVNNRAHIEPVFTAIEKNYIDKLVTLRTELRKINYDLKKQLKQF